MSPALPLLNKLLCPLKYKPILFWYLASIVMGSNDRNPLTSLSVHLPYKTCMYLHVCMYVDIFCHVISN